MRTLPSFIGEFSQTFKEDIVAILKKFLENRAEGNTLQNGFFLQFAQWQLQNLTKIIKLPPNITHECG